MKVSSLLTESRIVVPLTAAELTDALLLLLDRIAPGSSSEERRALAERVARRAKGFILRVNEMGVLVAAQSEHVEDLSVALGVAPEGIAGLEDSETKGGPRIVMLLLTPRPVSTLKAQVIPTLTRMIRDAEFQSGLLAARSPADVRAEEELMSLDLQERPLVQDAMSPVTYRVYPDTPISEVMDLMVRRGVQAVPVIGEKYEFLGIITAGDALSHLLPRRMSGSVGETEGGEGAASAREVMSRSVMCVSEEQGLLEAATLMANKHVNQLPVVKEGELVGLLTREKVLKVLFGKR